MIRLQRVGRRNQGSFRVIVTPKKSPPRGRVIEELGVWNPKLDQVSLKQDRISYWLSQGAKPSPTVHNLLVGQGVTQGKRVPKHQLPKKGEATVADASTPSEATPAAA